MRRVLVLIGLCLLLGACGEDAGEAFVDSRTPPSLPPRAWAPDGWTWGVIRIPDTPDIRYGVAAPPGRPLGHIVFVTDYGEPAEAYFESARDLLARGWAVWTLEPHGQGGSGRFPGPRDVGRSAGFERDAGALRILVAGVIRPPSDAPVVLAAEGSGALIALLALEAGLPASAALLWRPDLDAVEEPRMADLLTGAGLGLLRAEGEAWSRPTGRLDRRSLVGRAWQTANPDLRLGGRGFSWLQAEHAAVRRATAAGALERIRTPVVVAGRSDLCRRISGCRRAADAGPAPHRADDHGVRRSWTGALLRLANGVRPTNPAHEK